MYDIASLAAEVMYCMKWKDRKLKFKTFFGSMLGMMGIFCPKIINENVLNH
jgi:hypothetical protein